jgi:hypothetical protein
LVFTSISTTGSHSASSSEFLPAASTAFMLSWISPRNWDMMLKNRRIC